MAVFAGLIAGWLGGVSTAHAQQVLLPNQEYTETRTDLSVQTVAGLVSIRRTWTAGKWYLNPAWANLRFINDPLGGVLAVERAGSVYERTGSDAAQAGGRIYRFDDDNFIQQTASGWRWYDRLGNTVHYDGAGVIQDYGNPHGSKVSFSRDGQGRMVEIRDPLGRAIYTLDYDIAGRVERITDLGGASVRYQWNPAGQLEEVTDSRGQRWRYGYDSHHQIILRTSPSGASTAITYATPPGEQFRGVGFGGMGASGATGSATSSGRTKVPTPQIARVATYRDEEGATWSYRVEFDRMRQEYSIAIQRPDASQSVRRYSKDGWLLHVAVQEEPQFQRIIDSTTQHRLLDARGQTTTVHLDGSLRPLRTIYPDGSAESSQYDGQGRIVRHTNALGAVTTWRYDARGSLLEKVEALGLPEQRTHSYTYDERGYVLTYNRGAGSGQGTDVCTENYVYDSWGNTIQWRDGTGQTWAYTHNVRGDVVSEVNPLGHVWKAAYDPHGAMLRAENPLGHIRQYQYNGSGLPAQFTDAMGHDWLLAYDKTGRLTQLTDPLGHVWKQSHDPLGRTTLRINPSGQQTQTRYDLLGRSVEAIDLAGNRTRYEYGAKDAPLAGLRTATAFPTFKEIYRYDQLGRPTQAIQQLDADTSRTFHYAWDALGRNVATTDPAGNTTLYRYDALGRRTETVDSLNQSTRQTWDAHGNITTATDAKGNTHRYSYDKAGRRTAEHLPGGAVTRFQYDAAGQLVLRTDAGGNTRRYQYDSAGNLTAEEHQLAGAGTDQRISYQYNANSLLSSHEQLDGAGRRISAVAYQRDSLGRITQRTIRYGDAITHTLGQSYDADGRLAGHTYPDGSQGQYSYIQGRLSQVLLPNASAITYQDYQWHMPKRIQYPGTLTTKAFDSLLRPKSIQVQGAGNQTLASRQYQYDLVGNINRITSDLGQTDYGYDAIQRLTQVQPDASLRDLGLPVEQYGYDPVHNRTNSAHQPGEWSYNQDNQLIQYPQRKNGQSVPTQVQYNAQGHTQQETSAAGTAAYVYNAAERLIGFEETPVGGASIQASYQYDPFGRRISKTVTQGASSQTTYYLYGDDGLLAELNGQGQMTRAYGWNPVSAQSGLWSTDPLWQAEVSSQNSTLSAASTTYHYLHTDHLATPMVATDKSGAQTWKGISEAFGQMRVDNASAITMNLRLPGQYFDGESGRHYNFHRDYEPELGRYIQSDPIGLNGGWNRFGYVGGNPLSFVDPEGLQFLDLTTLAGARRNTTLDDAVRAGAWTRAITLPAVTAGLTPSAIGLVGSASAPLFCAAPETITVSRWGREGLEAGDWVMKGGQNWWTYARSFKWQPGMGNQFAPYGTGASYQIPASAARWPTGVGIDGAWKGLFGQRIYLP